jgi:hypothetical protein
VPAEGSYSAVSAFFGANLEVMAPAIPFIPGGSRFFATAEILPTFAPQGTVALDDAATDFVFPPGTAGFYPAGSIGGVGSRLRATVMTTVLAANVGAAFEFDMAGRRVRLKPSVGWIRWGVLADGQVLDAYKDDPIIPPVPPPPGGPYGKNFRLVKAVGNGAGFFNAIGPGLELEMDTARHGHIGPSLYISAFAYRTVGNDTINFQSSVPVDDALGSAVYNAYWTFRVEPWSYRAALGLRFRWLGN